jgi:hypothetical protein
MVAGLRAMSDKLMRAFRTSSGLAPELEEARGACHRTIAELLERKTDTPGRGEHALLTSPWATWARMPSSAAGAHCDRRSVFCIGKGGVLLLCREAYCNGVLESGTGCSPVHNEIAGAFRLAFPVFFVLNNQYAMTGRSIMSPRFTLAWRAGIFRPQHARRDCEWNGCSARDAMLGPANCVAKAEDRASM